MRSHSQTPSRRRAGTAGPRGLAGAPRRFLDAWTQLVGPAGLPRLPRRRGRKAHVPLRQVWPALTFHVMQGAGTLAEHFEQLFGVALADSSWAARRARLPWDVFADLLRRLLRPLATRRRHPDAFWRGWRLVALDGTQFSLRNTAQIVTRVRKAQTRRGQAAFAKLTTVVLLELGLHNPLAAAIGKPGQSEWELACHLLRQLPAGALLLADRLYGCAAFAAQALATCTQVGSHVLLRARRDLKVGVVQRLADGSRLVVVAVRDAHSRRMVDWLHLREIRVRVKRPGRRGHELRLWTSLLDPTTAPALELAQLYARRWEHELYYRELKRELRKTELLQSHTVETAAQEVAALVLASALLAAERARVATRSVPALRVSFIKVFALVQPLWLMLGLLDDVISEDVKAIAVKRVYRQMRRCVTRKRRRPRSCPRAVRQPVKGWPRLLHTQSVEGEFHFTVR